MNKNSINKPTQISDKERLLKEKASKIKIMAFDVDGVFTDGSLVFDENGQAEPVGKEVTKEDKMALLESVEKCPTEAITIIEE